MRRTLEEADFVVVGEAADGEAAVRFVESTAPDLAVIDVRMPSGGITAAEEIARRSPGTLVVMLTVSDEDDDLFAALRVGAVGYVVKGGEPANLPELLRRTLKGEAVLDGSMLAKVLGAFRESESRRLVRPAADKGLSPRELEVLELLEQGATTSEIASRLYIARVTVRSHVASICKKLNLTGRESLRPISAAGEPGGDRGMT